jgi:DNA-binding response OmpR family regulator
VGSFGWDHSDYARPSRRDRAESSAEHIARELTTERARSTTSRRIGSNRGLSGCDARGKPFSYQEVRARIDALLRRCRGRRSLGRVRVGALEIDPAAHTVLLHGTQVVLSQKEFALLRVLAAEPSRVWSKEELLRTVWGYQSLGRTRTIDSHACRLRRKLGAHGDRYVVNVWGIGYRLLDPVVPSVLEAA